MLSWRVPHAPFLLDQPYCILMGLQAQLEGRAPGEGVHCPGLIYPLDNLSPDNWERLQVFSSLQTGAMVPGLPPQPQCWAEDTEVKQWQTLPLGSERSLLFFPHQCEDSKVDALGEGPADHRQPLEMQVFSPAAPGALHLLQLHRPLREGRQRRGPQEVCCRLRSRSCLQNW